MRSGFFNSEITGYDSEGMPIFDRAEEATFFAKYFSQFIGNGVFPNPSTNLQVLEASDMNVSVSTGTCFINGYLGWAENAEVLEIEESNTQPRIDRIVARLDFEDRSITLAVKKGTASGNPTAPEIQRDYDIYEMALADVTVPANAISISQSNITDQRSNSTLCGIVAGLIQQIDTTTLFNQYQTWLSETTSDAETSLSSYLSNFSDYIEGKETDFNAYIAQSKTDFDTYIANLKLAWANDIETLKAYYTSDFNTWFAGIQDILDESTAGHLLNLIQGLDSSKVDKVQGKGLSTEDFTTAEKTKLASLENYDDTTLSGRVTNVETKTNYYVKKMANATIDVSEDVEQNVTTELYEATITDASITANDKVNFDYDVSSMEVAKEAEDQGYTVSYNGYFKLFFANEPTEDMTGSYTVFSGSTGGVSI